MEKNYNLLIIDDFQISALGTKALLQGYTEFENIFIAFSLYEALDILSKNTIDVVLCDIFMPEQDGFYAIKYIKEYYPETKLMFLSISEDKEILLKSFAYRADGYQFKDVAKEELYHSICVLLKGKKYFNSKILDILFDEISHFADLFFNNKTLQTIERLEKSPNVNSLKFNQFNDNVNPKFSNTDLKAILTNREIDILILIGKGLSTKEIANKLNISTFTVSTHRKNINTKLNIQSLREMKIIAQELLKK
jgi:DNA-binding NarL/FixJ family response regulator